MELKHDVLLFAVHQNKFNRKPFFYLAAPTPSQTILPALSLPKTPVRVDPQGFASFGKLGIFHQDDGFPRPGKIEFCGRHVTNRLPMMMYSSRIAHLASVGATDHGHFSSDLSVSQGFP